MVSLVYLGRDHITRDSWFFVATFLLISFLPQFGISRLWMYSTLIIYGVIEGGVRRVVLWIVDPTSQGAMVCYVMCVYTS